MRGGGRVEDGGGWMVEDGGGKFEGGGGWGFEGGGGCGMVGCGGGGVSGGGGANVFVKFWESDLSYDWNEGWDSGAWRVVGSLLLGSRSYPVLDVSDVSFSPPGGPGTGFLPSFMAFLISAAFHAAYFCFCSRSG